MENLKGLKVAILVTDGFEQVELTEPRKALDPAGADTKVVSPKNDRVRGCKFTEWGDELAVDVPLEQAHANNFDALLLPGGVINPDKLRMEPKAISFVKSFFDDGKPVAAICHGSSTIIEAGVARGKHIASWPSLKTDLRNAGVEWVDTRSCCRAPEVRHAFHCGCFGAAGFALEAFCGSIRCNVNSCVSSFCTARTNAL